MLVSCEIGNRWAVACHPRAPAPWECGLSCQRYRLREHPYHYLCCFLVCLPSSFPFSSYLLFLLGDGHRRCVPAEYARSPSHRRYDRRHLCLGTPRRTTSAGYRPRRAPDPPLGISTSSRGSLQLLSPMAVLLCEPAIHLRQVAMPANPFPHILGSCSGLPS